jgi:hypothetical protein
MPRQSCIFFGKEERERKIFFKNGARLMGTEPASGMYGLLLQPKYEKNSGTADS